MPLLDRYESSPTQRLFLLISLAVLGVAATAGTSAFASSLSLVTDTSRQNLREIPVVVGMAEAEAVVAVEALGFDAQVVHHQNFDVAAGVVSRQVPVAGARLPEGSEVEIWISAGDAFVPVPEVIGSNLDETAYHLLVVGLEVGEVTREESDALEGEVIDQSPAVGEIVAHGTTVDLVVSAGPPSVEIPDVSGLYQSEAARALRDAGFQVTISQRSSWNVDPGFAVATDPPAGDELQRGSTITLFVSSGRPPTTTTTEPPEPDPDESTTTTTDDSDTTTTTSPEDTTTTTTEGD